jgi:hypothetical protein
VPETKGRTLEQIEKMWSGGEPASRETVTHQPITHA